MIIFSVQVAVIAGIILSMSFYYNSVKGKFGTIR
jgi:ABC-type molybdate transport system permease subunit